MENNSGSASDQHWDDFVANYWEKKPAVFRNVVPKDLIPPKELFDIMTGVREQFSAKKKAQGGPGAGSLQLFIGNGLRSSGLVHLLPCPDDRNIEGYSERMVKTLPAPGEFCLHIENLTSMSYDVNLRARRFMLPLLRRIGLPAMQIELDMFLGNYANTPFGVHKDNCSVFTLVPHGVKRILAWKYEDLAEFADGDLRELGCSLGFTSQKEVGKEPIVLEAQPGDLMYFPASYWHVAEGNGQLSLSFTLGVYRFVSPIYHLQAVLDRAISDRAREKVNDFPFDPSNLQRRVDELPKEYTDITKEMRRAANEDLEREAIVKWLEHTTGLGLGAAQAPKEDITLNDTDVVRLNVDAGFGWRTLLNGELAVGVDGHVHRWPESRGLVEALQKLQSGRQIAVGEEAKRATSERLGEKVVWSEQVFRDVLNRLTTYRALVKQ